MQILVTDRAYLLIRGSCASGVGADACSPACWLTGRGLLGLMEKGPRHMGQDDAGLTPLMRAFCCSATSLSTTALVFWADFTAILHDIQVITIIA